MKFILMFFTLQVLSVLFIPTHLVVLSTLAVETALVIDIGYKEATIIPVYCGVQVLHAWQAQAIAAEAVHDDIKRQLLECGIHEELLTPEIIEDIKGKTLLYLFRVYLIVEKSHFVSSGLQISLFTLQPVVFR